MLTIKRKCTICGGDGIDKEKVIGGENKAVTCSACKGVGYFVDDTIDVEEIIDRLDDLTDKADDLVDKVNDVKEVCDEIKEEVTS